MADKDQNTENDLGYGSMDDLFSGVGLDESIYSAEKQGVITSSLNAVSSSLGIIVLSGFASALFVAAVLVPLAMLASAAQPALSWYKELPTDLPDTAISERNVIYDANGDEIAEFWTEDRIMLDDSDQISEHAIDALIATEDRRFYEHEGYDPIGILRSAVTGSGGGSGITQQLVKNLQYYDQSSSEEEQQQATAVSLERKFQELRYAIEYENNHSKDEILLKYFNTVSFGGPNVYSIESAAQYFFGKSASDLNLSESAVLIGSVQNTSLFNLEDPDREDDYKRRQRVVLDSMVDNGDITQEQADKAYDAELDIQENERSNGCQNSDYPFYCDYVIDHLREDPALGSDAEERNAVLAAGGLEIQTALDPEVSDTLDEMSTSSLGNDNRVTMPLVTVEPGTGNVTGFGFNRDYGTGEGETQINIADSPTGTGSSFKMTTLAAALNNGYNANNLEFSSACPWTKPGWDTPAGGVKNSMGCGLQGGYLDYEMATAVSSNTWFVELQSRIGVSAVEEYAESVGLPTPEGEEVSEGSSSYTLGPQQQSPIDMAAAYATYAAEGVFCPATPVTEVKYEDGSSPRVPDDYDPSEHGCQRVLSPQSASTVLTAMKANTSTDVTDQALGADAAIDGYDAVGKSGTNQMYNQAWAMVSGQYSLYANVYDYESPARGIDGYWADGEWRAWHDNSAQRVGSSALEELLQPLDNESLSFNSTDSRMEPVPKAQMDFITVPSVIGMEPEAALSVIRGTGLSAYIEKDKCEPEDEPENGFPPGVIVGQSVAPGENLPKGTDTEILVCSNR